MLQHDNTFSSTGDDKVKVVRKTWIELALDFDLDASTVSLAEVDGPEPKAFTLTPGTAGNNVIFGSALPVDHYQVKLGAVEVNADSPSAHVYIDDVTLTLK